MNELLDTCVYCPYCGEKISVAVEVLDESQEYVEDCQVCCRPIVFNVVLSVDGSSSVSVRSENETY
ncbi:CPXCG motif-containing cysteine-rich protein [Teredinibacter haidensis]|uniref:CPXCG motif-containing cysteine-rich protein n=1 Tax=Teredinibacter haidensis TaxID=2731755 RepID=UPI00094908F7|nr:CPXCG motif-containing cysteine-rich protein [Teredinibacter haidensis]